MSKKDYIEAINEINADENLKNNTLQKMKDVKKKKKKPNLIYSLALATIVFIIAISIAVPINHNKNTADPIKQVKEENGLPKVESFENLYNIVRKQNSENKDSQKNASLLEDSVNSTLRENNDYSKTNNQVEGVEEADIVKTDGKYIYYITGKKLVIVNAVEATNMKIASEIKYEEEQIEPKEIFINGNRLIIVEQKYEYNGQINENSVMDDMIYPSDEYTNIKVYNIDKLEQIEINSIQESDSVDDTVFKPFAISEESSMQIRTGTLREEIVNVEKQHIYTGDSVLFVNRSISRLLAYHSYLINDMTKVGTKYQMSLEIEGAVNRRQEDVLLAELKEEARRQNENDQHGLLIDILNYSKYMQNIKGVSEKNQDIEPVNLVIRALSELDYLHENELKYLLAEMILGNLNYSDAIDLIIEKRNSGVIITSEREAELDYKFVNALVAGRLLEWSDTDAGKVLRLAEDLDSTYLEQLKRLMVYAVDISKSSNKKDNASLPLSIKAVSVDDSVGNKELSEICIRIIENPKIVQGDYIILVKNDFCCIANYMVYQVISVQKSDEYMKLEIAKHSFINKDKEDEILKDLKEAYYGECE